MDTRIIMPSKKEGMLCSLVSQTDSKQSWASVSSCMPNRADSALLWPCDGAARLKRRCNCLHVSRRKHAIAFTLSGCCLSWDGGMELAENLIKEGNGGIQCS